MTTPQFTSEYVDLAREIFECRACRDRSPEFARETISETRHPEMAHGSSTPTILIVSINPKYDPNRQVDVDLATFMKRAMSPASVNEANAFDQALAKALPNGYALKNANVTNTRVYKCATPSETKVKGVATACADRFLSREVRIMKPRVVLAMGKPSWPEVFRILNAGPVPEGAGPHEGVGSLGVPIVACWHLSGNVQARSNSYRFAVRRLICDALGIAHDV